MENEFEIDFIDEVLNSTNGIFEDVNKAMLKDSFSQKWMLSSRVIIKSDFGLAEMVVHFYYDRNIYIADFVPSTKGDAYYNPDISCLSVWAKNNGWAIPRPLPDLARTNVDFWKHFWETYVIDSPDYFDIYYGKRPEMDFDDNKIDQ